MVRQSIVLFIVASGFGVTIGLGLFLWPRRVIRQAELALVDQIKNEAEATYRADLERQRSTVLSATNAELETANQKATLLTRQLEQKNRELETFLFSVSHDLKTPLVSIHGFIEILQENEDTTLTEESKRALGRIRANVGQMQRLIEDLLNLSRIGRQERCLEAVNVARMVEEIVENCRARVPGRSIQVAQNNLFTITTERRCLQQVFENLISNAFKFLGDQPAPVIRVAAHDEGDVVSFEVEDNGIGIAPEYHAKIFSLFQRLGDIDVEGTGVGLAIVKRMVEDMGGMVELRSAPGQGASFSFTWPKHPAIRERSAA